MKLCIEGTKESSLCEDLTVELSILKVFKCIKYLPLGAYLEPFFSTLHGIIVIFPYIHGYVSIF